MSLSLYEENTESAEAAMVTFWSRSNTAVERRGQSWGASTSSPKATPCGRGTASRYSLSNEEKGHVHSNGWLYVIADLVASMRRFLRNQSQALSFARWWVNKPFSIDKDLPFRAAKGESRRGWRLVAAPEIEMKSCLLL